MPGAGFLRYPSLQESEESLMLKDMYLVLGPLLVPLMDDDISLDVLWIGQPECNI